MSSIVLGLALLVPTAQAFQPTDTPAPAGTAVRVRTATLAGQSAARHQHGWARFTKGAGAGWNARFDEVTGTPLRAWGPPVPMTVGTADDAGKSVLGFVAAHADAVGATGAALAVRSANYAPDTDTWYVDVEQRVGGLPIEGATFTARVRSGRLVQFGSTLVPSAQPPAPPSLLPQRAVDLAIAAGPAANSRHDSVAVELVGYPVVRVGSLAVRPAYRVTSRTEAPVGQWVTFIDGDSGAVLAAENRVHFVAGDVQGLHELRTMDGETTTSPLPFVRLSSPELPAAAFADASGAYDLPATSLTGTLKGQWFRVDNRGGTDASFPVTGGTLVLDSSVVNAAELSSYVFLHRVRDWQQAVAPEVDLGVMTANVNVAGTCNAYYDGAVNFLQGSSQCNNSGRVGDVVFHEWGHGFHGESILSGVWDGSMSEGIADTVAFLQTGDPRIGPYFFTNGDPIRNVSPNKVFPDDFVPSDEYVHPNGLIYGGSMWDLWDRLVTDLGAEAGTAETTRIFTGMLKGGPTLETAFDEAVFADDDDADLSNGTPNLCALIDSFGPHGLGFSGGAGVYVPDHVPADSAEPVVPHPVTVSMVNLAPQCGEFEIDQAFVSYRVDGGDWQDVSLTVSPESAAGAIPGQELGSFVEYYLTVLDDAGDEVMLPEGGPINPFSMYVGDVIELYCDDFEASDGGFTSELLSGEDVEGANDWLWGTPYGQGGDPASAASGAKIWGTDLGEEGWNGQYQDERETRLSSPPIATEHYQGAFLHYRRWLTIEDGVYDQARILADGEVVWSNWATNQNNGVEHHIDREWRNHAVDLRGAGDDGSVTVSFELQSDGGLTFGGWNLDDLCVYAPATADNRLAIIDFTAASDAQQTVRLAWTQPRHAPVERVVVVRTEDRLPTGPEDGVVVAEMFGINPSEAVEVFDSTAPRRQGLAYAVYASDGEEWLSWTVVGRNAALIGLEVDVETGEVEPVRRCACDGTGAPISGVWALAAAGLWLRRRRSR